MLRLFVVLMCLSVQAHAGRGEPPAKPTVAVSLQNTSTGLVLSDLSVGAGPMVRPGDVVLVDYTGWLADGTRFDSSLLRAEPFRFKAGAGAVIKGWDQGVIGMRVGGRRQLHVPARLGYGSVGAGPIPAGADLIFEIELRGIETSPTMILNPPYLEQIGGLMQHDVVVGTGAMAVQGSTVKVHYTGWLQDGAAFDSSHDRGRPIEFKVGAGRVIKGWDLGVMGMRVGGSRQLLIPPSLGYGPRRVGPLPPNSTLVFAVELVEVVP